MVTIYRKAGRLLVNDGFDWGSPKTSHAPRPLALHGTSNLLVEEIQKEGLRYVCPIISKVELAAFRDYFDGAIISSHLADEPPRLCLTTGFRFAADYAKQGPEILHRIRESCQCRLHFGGKVPAKVTAALKKIERFYAKHKPIVLFIDSEAYPLDLPMLKKLIQFWYMQKADAKKLRFSDMGRWLELNDLRRSGFSLEEAVQISCRELHGEPAFRPNEIFIPKTAIKGFVEVSPSD